MDSRPRSSPCFGHAEHADLVDAAESVLGRAKDAVVEHAFALEVEHRVDDVLERLRSGDSAALRDVADDEDRGAGFLREAHQSRGALAHLPDVAGRALEIAGEDRLDRIDDERVGPLRAGGGEDRLEDASR